MYNTHYKNNYLLNFSKYLLLYFPNKHENMEKYLGKFKHMYFRKLKITSRVKANKASVPHKGHGSV